MLYLSGIQGGRVKFMRTKRKSQAVLEYTVLFGVVLTALVTSLFFVNIRGSLRSQFRNLTARMCGDSLVWEE